MNNHKLKISAMGLGILFFFSTAAAANADTAVSPQPFVWACTYADGLVTVRVDIQENHYLYREQTLVQVIGANGKQVQAVKEPAPAAYNDPFSGPLQVYPGKGCCSWQFKPQDQPPFAVKIRYQGCRKKSPHAWGICYPPAAREFQITAIP